MSGAASFGMIAFSHACRGPFGNADFIGLDVCLDIMRVLQKGFAGNPKYRPCPLLEEMVADGRLGKKSGQGFYTYEGAK
jgi:3-hydroxybutyryl-CoA dehydrogenase